MFIYLQEDYVDVPRTQRTLHYLAACVQQSTDEIKEFLPVWISEHEDWCRCISKKYLKKRNIQYKQYVKEFLHPAFPMDLLGIGIFARAYKKHVAVFYNTKFWCTEINRDLSKVSVFLVYTGRMDFENTHRMHVWEYNSTRDIILKYQKQLEKDREIIEPSETESEVSSDESSDVDNDTERRPVIEMDEDIEDIMNNTLNTGDIPHNITENETPDDNNVDENRDIQHNIHDSDEPVTENETPDDNVDENRNIQHNIHDSDEPVTENETLDDNVDENRNIQHNIHDSGEHVTDNETPDDLHDDRDIQHNIHESNANVTLVDDNEDAEKDGKSEDIMSKDELDKSTDSGRFKRYLNDQVISSGQHLVQQFVEAENKEQNKDVDDKSDQEIDLEDVLEKGVPVVKTKPTNKNQRKSKQIQQKKKRDKIKQDRMQLTPVKESSARKTVNSMKSDYGHLVKDIMSKCRGKKSTKGFWKIQPRGILLRTPTKKRKAVFRCFLCGNKDSTSAKQLNDHIMQKHPGHKFKCRVKGCTKQFSTKNSLYRHQLAHKGMCYFCKRKSCDKAFVWKHQLVDHMKSHTKKNMYQCDFPGCDKEYATKRACQRHKKLKHSPSKLTYTCNNQFDDGTDCTSTFTSKQQFDQHVQGLHGVGFKTRCGKYFTWPYQRADHQKECQKCDRLKQKKKNTF